MTLLFLGSLVMVALFFLREFLMKEDSEVGFSDELAIQHLLENGYIVEKRSVHLYAGKKGFCVLDLRLKDLKDVEFKQAPEAIGFFLEKVRD